MLNSFVLIRKRCVSECSRVELHEVLRATLKQVSPRELRPRPHTISSLLPAPPPYLQTSFVCHRHHHISHQDCVKWYLNVCHSVLTKYLESRRAPRYVVCHTCTPHMHTSLFQSYRTRAPCTSSLALVINLREHAPRNCAFGADEHQWSSKGFGCVVFYECALLFAVR